MPAYQCGLSSSAPPKPEQTFYLCDNPPIRTWEDRRAAYHSKGDLQQATALNPQHANTYYNRGLTYAMTGDYGQALKDLDKALAPDPADAGAYLAGGHLHKDIRKREESIADFEKALELGLIPDLEQEAAKMLEELRK